MGLFSRKITNPLPPVNKKTGSLVINDKLLIVVSVNAEEIKSLVTQFCKLYRRNDYAIEIKLHPVEEGIVALTFPNDFDFVVFFYLVKHLNYAGQSSVKVLGWCTLPPIGANDPVSKQAMIYMDENYLPEKTVCITTQDNSCWKIDFNKNQYKPSVLLQPFSNPPYSFIEIKHREGYLISV
ncbi:MAG: hypothetical protein LBL58_18415 [Tannerellaceae bacterium]|jgi:hypothetical protein|nr:hypothetical protein [Tannerellaceae bacterium]